MLKLVNIKKNYSVGKGPKVTALKSLDLEFSKSQFVAILGPSGCGKTTLLNIIGGLDQYTSGDLVIDGVSTKQFSSNDWDNYRNKKVGIIFQSYNLIPHLTVLGNVALSMTLAGQSKKIREEKASKALDLVGLSDQKHKKPNQLSGGQMQRVAIARAIVNDPHILLCDEPTGALDSKTSVQVMEILADLAKDHLIIMVSHNEELATEYCSRIVRLKDGELISDEPNSKCRFNYLESKGSTFVQDKLNTIEMNVNDLPKSVKKSNKVKKEKAAKEAKHKKEKKSRMGFGTALSISGKNLMTKRGRTTMTSIAGSFGIIGVSLVLALQNGFTNYMSKMETETLTGFPLTVEQYAMPDMTNLGSATESLEKFPSDGSLHISKPVMTSYKVNNLTNEYVEYVSNMEKAGVPVNSVQKNYSLNTIVVTENKTSSISGAAPYKVISTSASSSMMASMMGGTSSYWNQLPGSEEFVLSQYDIVEGRYPTKPNELVITVDKYNRISENTLEALGFDTSSETMTKLSDLVETKEFKMYKNSDFYTNNAKDFDITDTSETAVDDFIKANPDKAQNFVKGLKLKRNADFTQFMMDIANLTSSNSGNTNEFFSKFLTYFETYGASNIGEIMQRASDYHLVPQYNSTTDLASLWNDKSIQTITEEPIKVVGVLRIKDGVSFSSLSSGVYYLPSLTELASGDQAKGIVGAYEKELIDARTTNINLYGESGCTSGKTPTVDDRYNADAKYVLQDDISDNVFLTLDGGKPSIKVVNPINGIQTTDISTYNNLRKAVGTDSEITSLTIYPKDFDSKNKIIAYLDAWNQGKDEKDQVVYNDVAGLATSMVSDMVQIVSAVLIVFASISLVVSSVMIGIITYVSVIERKKEIGILRSIGARKKDVGILFIAEATMIGFLAGAIGVLISYLLTIPINLVMGTIFPDLGLGMIANLNPFHAVLMILVSIFLTFVAGLIPSRIASKKNPVECLRTE